MKRFALIFAVLLSSAWAEPPRVLRVEPPDWVAPVRSTSLRLMVTGSGLAGAALRVSHGPARAGPAKASPEGRYLWADLNLPAGMPAGDLSLSLVTPAGSTTVPFRLTPNLPAATHFQGFSSSDVIYLIMPDRFANGDPRNDEPAVSKGIFDRANRRLYHGGDFAGIRQRLPYLKELGVTAIWLTPIYDNANAADPHDEHRGEKISSYHGYGATDFYGVEEHFGTLEEYCQLVEAAHALGFKVIQDQVANHTGAQHPWLDNPPLTDWFHGTPAAHLDENWQVWSLLDPHASPAIRRVVLDGWFGNTLPDLNQDNTEVARYLIQNTLWWIGRTGVDGIREDTVPYAPRPFWRDWSAAIHRDYPHIRMVGEAWDEDTAFTGFYQGGHKGWDGIDTGIDMVFDFPLYGAIRKVFASNGSPEQLARVFAHDSAYTDPGRLVTFLGLHDNARFLSEAKGDDSALERAFTFLFGVRGTPMIYSGDEIGMSGGDDPENRRDFPGGWPGDSHNAFDAASRAPIENRLFDRVKKLAALRASSSALRQGTQVSVYSSRSAYAFVRVASSGQRALVVVQNSPETKDLDIDLAAVNFPNGEILRDVLGGAPSLTLHDGHVSIHSAEKTVRIYITK